MKLKHLLIINAIIALAYALGELFVPATLGSIYGLKDTANPVDRSFFLKEVQPGSAIIDFDFF